LADQAGITTQSVRNHLESLVAFSFVLEEAEGYRLALSFHTEEERYADVLPTIATGPEHQQLRDVVFDVVEKLVDDRSRLSDPDDPIGGAFYWPADLTAIREQFPEIGPLIEIAGVFVGSDPEGERRKRVRFGADLEQQALQSHSRISLPG
ncbi:MAG: hypothetical protein ABEI52_01580, partial [Halobacteriaceae archaeon]